MKRLVALALSIVIMITMLSCSQVEETADTEKNTRTDYSKIIDMYRQIIDVLPEYFYSEISVDIYADEFGIADKDRDIFDKLFYSSVLFYPHDMLQDTGSPITKLAFGYVMKDINRDGVDELIFLTDEYYIIAIFSFYNDSPILLGSYKPRNSCQIDGDGSLHVYSSSGFDRFSHTVYKLSNGGKGLELITKFGADGSDIDGEISKIKYYEMINGEKIIITEEKYDNLSELNKIKAPIITEGIEINPVFNESDVILDMYDAALSGVVPIVDTDFGNDYFINYIKEINSAGNITVNGKIVMDIDNDGIDEVIISVNSTRQIDNIILKYYDGKVYIKGFYFRNLYNLKTDGSFGWNSVSENTYGESILKFDNGEFKTKTLWHIVNDGAPNAEYYIGDDRVTHDEILRYFSKNPKRQAEYLPYELPNYVGTTESNSRISLDEAIEIASDHWNIKSGDVDKETGFPFAIVEKQGEGENYFIALTWLVDNHHYSTIEIIEIDAYTGEIVDPCV